MLLQDKSYVFALQKHAFHKILKLFYEEYYIKTYI